jgi:hypothetical protein
MALFMDFHEELKLPAEALAQIAEDARNARADRFGVRQVELSHNPDGKVYCLLEGPDEDAIRQHHAAPRRALRGRAPRQQPDMTAAVRRGRQVAAGRAIAWPGPAPAQAAAAPVLAQVPRPMQRPRSTSRPAPNNHAAVSYPATTWANPRSGERHGREPGSHPAGQPQPR